METLIKVNYQGFVSAEILPLPDPDTAAKKNIEFLSKIVNWLILSGSPKICEKAFGFSIWNNLNRTLDLLKIINYCITNIFYQVKNL